MAPTIGRINLGSQVTQPNGAYQDASKIVWKLNVPSRMLPAIALLLSDRQNQIETTGTDSESNPPSNQ